MRPDLFPITFEGKLDRFIEECAEATQAICKLRRFGKKPTDPKTRIKYDNIHDMLMEMGQVEHAIGEVRQHLEANMQQGGDVGGLADRVRPRRACLTQTMEANMANGLIPPGNYTLGPCDEYGWATIIGGEYAGLKVHMPVFKARMQQGGDVGGLANRAQMPEFQHGFKSENYPYLVFSRKHNLDYGMVLARVDVFRRAIMPQDQTALESEAISWFNHSTHLPLYNELIDLYRVEKRRQHAVSSATKV